MYQDLILFMSSLIEQWLDKSTYQRFIEKKEKINNTNDKNIFFLNFSACTHLLEKKICIWEKDDIKRANELIENWMPQHWTLLEFGRIYLLLNLPHKSGEDYQIVLDELFQTADLGEAIALSKALPVLPYPQKHIDRSKLALRTNTKTLFEAVAHYNPYPCLYFDENTWNQMILKAVFIESPLNFINGIDKRSNVNLKNMLIDFVKERHSANRKVSPELWRCVAPFIQKQDIDLLRSIYLNTERRDALAVGLALKQSNFQNEVNNILSLRPEFYQRLEKEKITWNNILSIRLD